MKSKLSPNFWLRSVAAMFVMFPIIPNLATAFSFLLFIIAIFTGDWKRCDAKAVWHIAYVSWAYFALNVFFSFWTQGDVKEIPDFSPVLQFFYLPFLFLALALNLPKISITTYAKFATFLMLVVALMAILEGFIGLQYTNIRLHPSWLGGTELRLEFAYPDRVSLLTGNPLTFGDVTLPILFSILVGFLLINWRTKLFRTIVFGFGSFAVVILTLNRSSILVWLALVLIFVIYLFVQLNMRRRTYLVATFLSGLLMGSVFLAANFSEMKSMRRMASASAGVHALLNGEINETTVKDGSLLIRLDMYRAAIQAIKNHPFTGSGVPEMMPTIQNYLQTDIAKKYVAHTGMTVHSLILNSWLSSGIFGLICILFLTGAPLIYWSFNRDLRSNINLGYLAAIISASIFIAGLTNNVYFDDAKNTAFLSYIFLFIILASQMRTGETCNNIA